MNSSELAKFTLYLGGRSAEFSTWFERLSPDGPGGVSDVKKELRRTFERMTLDQAQATADAIIGTPEEPAYGGGWLRALRQQVMLERRKKARPLPKMRLDADGNETFRCGRCLDSGAVKVINPAAVRSARRGEFAGVSPAAVRCTCEAADERHETLPVFDEEKHIPYRRFADWLRSDVHVKPIERCRANTENLSQFLETCQGEGF